MGLLDKLKSTFQEQTPEEIKLANHVRSKVEEVRSSANRIASEGIWMTNIAYLLGVDGVAFNTNYRQFMPVNRTASYLRKNKLHVNKILPTIQNRLARLCKNPPKYDVTPESNDTEDKEAARLALQVLRTMWEKLNLDEKRIFLYMWVQECGHAYMKISWDLTAGDILTDPMTGEIDFSGDLRADIVSPFEVYPDPMAKTWDDVQWVIQAKVRPLQYFKDQYPEKGDLVKEEDAWLLSAQYEQNINSLNARGPSQGGMTGALKNSAIELIKYEKRSKKHPRGRMIVSANGILLDNKELPVGEIPFAKYDDVAIGGKYYSESIITHLRPIQDQYNETVRRRAEWTRRLLAGKYAAARGSGLGQESLNDESGEVLYFTPVPNAPNAGAPMPMAVPNIPQWAYTEEDRLDSQINYISGISDVSRGTLPSASIPAIGMQLLTEQDDTRIGVMTELHEHSWARVGTLILKYVQTFYKLPRKLKIAGEDLQYTVKEVKGDDLKNNTDVRVVKGSTLPGSKTLRRQEILNTLSQGLLGDPSDPKVSEKVLGMLEFGDVQGMWQDYGLDMSQIRRGIDMIENGMRPPASKMDNHAMWIQELNRFRKGDKFDALSPENQDLLLSVIEQHVTMLMDLSGQLPPDEPPPPPGMDPNQMPPPEGAPMPDMGAAPQPPMPPMGEPVQ